MRLGDGALDLDAADGALGAGRLVEEAGDELAPGEGADEGAVGDGRVRLAGRCRRCARTRGVRGVDDDAVGRAGEAVGERRGRAAPHLDDGGHLARARAPRAPRARGPRPSRRSAARCGRSRSTVSPSLWQTALDVGLERPRARGGRRPSSGRRGRRASARGPRCAARRPLDLRRRARRRRSSSSRRAPWGRPSSSVAAAQKAASSASTLATASLTAPQVRSRPPPLVAARLEQRVGLARAPAPGLVEGEGRGVLVCQPWRMGSMKLHWASTSSARVKSVASPRMASRMSRSYASGVLEPNSVP